MKKLALLLGLMVVTNTAYAGTCETGLMPAFTAQQALSICTKIKGTFAIAGNVTIAGTTTVSGNILSSAAGSYNIGSAALPFSSMIVGTATVNGQISHSVGNTSFVVGSLSNHEIEFRANNTKVWDMDPSGTLIGSGTGTIGWTATTGLVNVSCTTQCTTPCVIGLDTDAAKTNFVGCGSATAEACLCAGAS